VELPKRHVVFCLPAASTQCYYGSCPARLKASLGPCLAVPKSKRHLALGLQRRGSMSSATGRLGCCTQEGTQAPRSQRGFFHSNSSFLKFINDDNNIYTLINFNTNNNIFSTNNMNYYKNNIIYYTKYNNILEMNTINYTKK
jgi:hypothetical protein